MINCYWQVGEYISRRIANATWGDKTIDNLAKFIEKNHPDLKGYTRSNLYRMKQFYETYYTTQIVAPLARQLKNAESQDNIIVSLVVTQLTNIRDTILAQIGWTHHLIIFTRAKTPEEREFYIRACIKERYSKRELDRQISSGLFERVMLGKHQFRDVKKEHENPSIGILLCQDQDTEVVKYALNRSMSPTLVAAYQTQLPDKNILQQKWKEIFEEASPDFRRGLCG